MAGDVATSAADCHSATRIEAPSFGDAAVLLCGLAIALFKFAQVVWFLCRRRHHFLQLARGLASSLRAVTPRCQRDDGGIDTRTTAQRDTEACVAERVGAKIEANTFGALAFLSQAVALGAVISAVTILRGGMRIFSFSQTCICIGFFVIVTAASVAPKEALAGRAGVAYSVLMTAACSVMFFSHPVAGNVFITEGIMLVTRVGMAVRYHKLLLVIVWNFIFSLFGLQALWNALGGPFLGCIVSYELWNLVAVIILCRSAAIDTEADIRRQVETLSLKGESSGLWTLLDLICDVVIPLDESLTIADEASRFGAMVTLQGRSVEGMRLQDFMPSEEDRDAFERCLQSEPLALPRALPVKLRDGLGNVITVELFCVEFWTLFRRRYLVGVRELSDAPPIAECRNFPSGPQQIRSQRRRLRRQAETARGPVSPSPPDSPADSPGSASSSSPASPQRRRRGRGAGSPAATSDMGLELALVHVLQLCSMGPAATDAALCCCPFHRAARHLDARMQGILAMQCAPVFGPKFDAQCRMCGFLAQAAGGAAAATCFACGSAVRLPRAAASPVSL